MNFKGNEAQAKPTLLIIKYILYRIAYMRMAADNLDWWWGNNDFPDELKKKKNYESY